MLLFRQYMNINTTNSFLILLSLLLAWFFPFELFLLAYAILGPLHYLTEIHWLHKKHYFVSTRYEPTLLIIGGTVLFVLLFSAISASDWAKILVGVCCASLVMVMRLQRNVRALLYLAITLLLLILPPLPLAFVLFSIFLPTLVHVYIFTGAFMLSGVEKEHDRSAFIAFLLSQIEYGILRLSPFYSMITQKDFVFVHPFKNWYFLYPFFLGNMRGLLDWIT